MASKLYLAQDEAEILVSLIKAYVQTTATGVAYDDTQVKADIKKNTDAITKLNGDSTTEGSVAKAVADAITQIVADAPESFDTLKEISDWISSHSESAAAMNSAITTNTTNITNLTNLVGTLPEGITSTTVIAYIGEAINKALTESQLSQYAKASDLEAAVTRIGTNETAIANINNAETGILKTAENYADGVGSAIQGNTTSTVKAVEDKVDDIGSIPEATVRGWFSTSES